MKRLLSVILITLATVIIVTAQPSSMRQRLYFLALDTLQIRGEAGSAALVLRKSKDSLITVWMYDSTVMYSKGLPRVKLDHNGVLSGTFSTQAGSIIGGEYIIDGSVIADKLINSSKSFGSNITFTSWANNRVTWSSGYIKLADGSNWTIAADSATMTTLTYIFLNLGGRGETWWLELPKNDGNMRIGNASLGSTKDAYATRNFEDGKAYILINATNYAPASGDRVVVQLASPYEFEYPTDFETGPILAGLIDALPGVSTSMLGDKIIITTDAVLDTTTAYADVAAENTILVCIAKPGLSGQRAFFVPSVGVLGLNSQNISPNSVTTDHLQANSVTAAKMYVAYLDAISAYLGTMYGGSLVFGSTNKMWFNEGEDGVLAIGGSVKANAPFRVSAAGIVKISNVSGANTIIIDPVGTYAFASGPTGAPTFTVTPAGALTATSATITGAIQSGSTITGTNITGGTWQTATSSTRIAVNEGSNPNDIRFYYTTSLLAYLSMVSPTEFRLWANELSIQSGGNVWLTGTTLTFNNNTIWNAGNDGSGSGLDADLLDGSHASAFSPMAGSSSLVTVGTITSGTWQGAAIADTYLATISTAGKVSGNAITSGTIGGSTAIQTSGLFETSNTTSASSSTYGRFSRNTLSFVNVELETNSGKIDFGAIVANQLNIIGYGTTNSNRLIAFYDIPKFTQVATGSGTALLGSNCPASTLSSPYTWLKIQTSDGSTAYIAAWK